MEAGHIHTQVQEENLKIEKESLQPRTLDDYIGQQQKAENLEKYISRQQGEENPSTMCCSGGPPDLEDHARRSLPMKIGPQKVLRDLPSEKPGNGSDLSNLQRRCPLVSTRS